VADTLTLILCITQGLYWMSALYAVYVGMAVYGYLNWQKLGKYVE
jgi:hypothetical protein